MSRRTHLRAPVRVRLLVLAALAALASPMALTTSSASAAVCGASTPNSVSYADGAFDENPGLAPDVLGGTATLNGGCELTLRYTTDQVVMIPGDFASWFIDTDGNSATGPAASPAPTTRSAASPPATRR